MADLQQKLHELFQSSDGALLPDEIALQNISEKQEELKAWNEGFVLQGFITIFIVILNLTPFSKDITKQKSFYHISGSW